MAMTLDSIVEETRQLPADVVAELVDRILRTRHGGLEPGVEPAWKKETRRRLAEIESGTFKAFLERKSRPAFAKNWGREAARLSPGGRRGIQRGG